MSIHRNYHLLKAWLQAVLGQMLQLAEAKANQQLHGCDALPANCCTIIAWRLVQKRCFELGFYLRGESVTLNSFYSILWELKGPKKEHFQPQNQNTHPRSCAMLKIFVGPLFSLLLRVTSSSRCEVYEISNLLWACAQYHKAAMYGGPCSPPLFVSRFFESKLEKHRLDFFGKKLRLRKTVTAWFAWRGSTFRMGSLPLFKRFRWRVPWGS